MLRVLFQKSFSHKLLGKRKKIKRRQKNNIHRNEEKNNIFTVNVYDHGNER